MKILRIQPEIDTPDRYNYQVNYGVWDALSQISDTTTISTSDLYILSKADIEKYDVALCPMFKRWDGWNGLTALDKLKECNIKRVLFDNDCCYRSFHHPFYDGFDFIFYRMPDKEGRTPKNGKHLKWSINEKMYTPVYGGSGVSFNCSLGDTYELRNAIARHIKPTNHKGKAYIEHLQNSAGAIHTDSAIAPLPRAKVLEYAACGTHIISNRVKGMNEYFPDGMVTYFDSVSELLSIIRNFKANKEIQMKARIHLEENHTDHLRALEVLEILRHQV
jgi:hypothetical protein